MPTLLFVDDDARLLTGLTRQCRVHRVDWRVLTASNGRAALLELERDEVDLVLTDILMPECDGLELVRKIRREWSRIPVIAMSGGGRFVTPECLDHAQRLGARAILHKPFAFADLESRVLELLSQPSV